jgi:S-adenosylmethionine decarboxylase
MEQTYTNHKGSHVLCDFIDFKGNEYVLGNFLFDLMIKAINRTTMTIVHKHLEILNKNTPAGFTSVLLLDSSHFTSHCYSELGLLSLDIFTCGPTNVLEVMEYVRDELIKKFPEIKCTYLKLHKRFRY